MPAAVMAVLASAAFVVAVSASARAEVPTPVPVPADAETVAVTHSGDAADDPALWVHPTDPAASLVIGNDKQGALEVYGLDGALQQRISTGDFWGNVDVRQGVRLGSRVLDLVATINEDRLRLFAVDPAQRLLQPATEPGISPTRGGEGICFYRSSATGQLSVFVVTRPGQVRQFVVIDRDDDGLLYAVPVREFAVGSESESCVADDARGVLYVSEEDVGVWQYGAEPGDGAARTLIDAVQPDGHLAADAEGLAIVDLGGGTGHLIASAQRVDDPKNAYFTVYDRPTGAFTGAFDIVDGPNADGCHRTDGIAAYAGDLGPAFPSGVFVCQDHQNRLPGTAGNQDFKLTRLEKVVDLGAAAVAGDRTPTAAFTPSCGALACTFDATASSDADGSIAELSWDFGDGTTGLGPTASHTYAAAGVYTVTLTVRDDLGAVDTVWQVVRVS